MALWALQIKLSEVTISECFSNFYPFNVNNKSMASSVSPTYETGYKNDLAVPNHQYPPDEVFN